ncbi:hypothetical protein GCM10027449_26370 [Sinomonas notoginsengisoli]|uniref:hypothetical protein n=1 Tax=Sinomonas notoginsengisoli TaxID=1457311 RepID=UPI001F39A2D9|nr:hypothetical protein [Sinomonas notoginsengisoli]
MAFLVGLRPAPGLAAVSLRAARAGGACSFPVPVLVVRGRCAPAALRAAVASAVLSFSSFSVSWVWPLRGQPKPADDDTSEEAGKARKARDKVNRNVEKVTAELRKAGAIYTIEGGYRGRQANYGFNLGPEQLAAAKLAGQIKAGHVPQEADVAGMPATSTAPRFSGSIEKDPTNQGVFTEDPTNRGVNLEKDPTNRGGKAPRIVGPKEEPRINTPPTPRGAVTEGPARAGDGGGIDPVLEAETTAPRPPRAPQVSRKLAEGLTALGYPAEDHEAMLEAAAADPETINAVSRLLQPSYARNTHNAILAGRRREHARTAPRCEEHPIEPADTCRCCLSEVAAGHRPEDMVGRLIAPADAPRRVMPANFRELLKPELKLVSAA